MKQSHPNAIYFCHFAVILVLLCSPQFLFAQAHSTNQQNSNSQQYSNCAQNNESRQGSVSHHNSDSRQSAHCEQRHEQKCDKRREQKCREIISDINIHWQDPMMRDYTDEQKRELQMIRYEVCRRSHIDYTYTGTLANTLNDSVNIYMNDGFIGYYKPNTVLFVNASEKVNVLITNKKGRALFYKEDADGIDLAKFKKGEYDVFVYNKNIELLKWKRISKQEKALK